MSAATGAKIRGFHEPTLGIDNAMIELIEVLARAHFEVGNDKTKNPTRLQQPMGITQRDPEVVIAKMLKNVAGVNAVRDSVSQWQTCNNIAKLNLFGECRRSSLEEGAYQREALHSQRGRNIKIDPTGRGRQATTILNVGSH